MHIVYIHICINIFEYISPNNTNLASVQRPSLFLSPHCPLLDMQVFSVSCLCLRETFLWGLSSPCINLLPTQESSGVFRYLSFIFVSLNYSWDTRKLSLIFSLSFSVTFLLACIRIIFIKFIFILFNSILFI